MLQQHVTRHFNLQKMFNISTIIVVSKFPKNHSLTTYNMFNNYLDHRSWLSAHFVDTTPVVSRHITYNEHHFVSF